MIDAIWKAKFGSGPTVTKPVVPVVKLEPAVAKKGETRQQKWRRLHPEKYREGQRKLMARKRQANSSA